MRKGEFGEPWDHSGLYECYCPLNHLELAHADACVNALDGYRPEELDRLIVQLRHVLKYCKVMEPTGPDEDWRKLRNFLAAFEGETSPT